MLLLLFDVCCNSRYAFFVVVSCLIIIVVVACIRVIRGQDPRPESAVALRALMFAGVEDQIGRWA
jgi:hypothetical protein